MAFVPTSAALRVLTARGFVAQCTDIQALDAALAAGPVVAYTGFDATAPSLHVGHLVSIMALRWLQQTGHTPIALLGGGTTLVGDPSFRATGRPMLDTDTIAANIAGIGRAFAPFLDFGPGRARMRNNADWLGSLNLLEFLRDVGRHTTVNRMLGFESVAARLDKQDPLSFLEFTYMLLQAADFRELHRREGCVLQIGGSDQWGNIINGVDLTRKSDGDTVWGLTVPLLTTANGQKMGKTAGGAVWLDPALCSPSAFWQFWRNVDDADVGRFLRLFTDLPLDECARLGALQGADSNTAKIVLADRVTSLLHGQPAAQQAHQAAQAVFASPDATAALDTTTLAPHQVGAGLSLAHLLVAAGLCASGKEAKRACQGGGVRLDGHSAPDPQAWIEADRLQEGITLSVGKKTHRRVRLG